MTKKINCTYNTMIFPNSHKSTKKKAKLSIIYLTIGNIYLELV